MYVDMKWEQDQGLWRGTVKGDPHSYADIRPWEGDSKGHIWHVGVSLEGMEGEFPDLMAEGHGFDGDIEKYNSIVRSGIAT